ncbi:N-acetylmuramoyl-L-alanine amidase [Bacillus thuringiensis]|uniref:N-acetylmuramoyl-L-alanine amidase n=1 Tax=Bacillus thuringiensis TaxID=1428 RepID=A0A9X7GHZ4_BACTU|nr:N-acetylmuramoyl-L-alanine amidase [Bacillus thuringiensis]PGH81041.1 N-acetylmuramoyl-L-alanine amidase [Bacillus thuringiensis]
MMRYSLHGGHNSIVQGANYGGRKEHVMARQVKDAVATKLRALEHTVYDDTDEVGSTQAQNLSNVVRNCNSHDVDLIVSFHLNAYDGKADGVEVCYYDQKSLAAKVAAQLSKDTGWKNRGAKQRTDLYVLHSTKAPAILLELGFIDNDADMAKWHVDKIANSIVYALTGQTVNGGGSQTITPPSSHSDIGKLVVVETPELWVYGSANWNDKVKVVKKGDAFTILDVLNVNGSKMYKCKYFYITASPAYVRVK